jgi:hypothetical protein
MDTDSSFLEIDKDNLDLEWLGQARKYFEYSEKLAKARQELDAVKTEQDVVYAELDQAIRTDPEKFGLTKTSEGAIKQAAISNERYGEVTAKLHALKYETDILSAAVAALDHRKRALEHLVTLWTNNYWAEPRIPETADRKKFEEREKKTVMKRVQSKTKKK